VSERRGQTTLLVEAIAKKEGIARRKATSKPELDCPGSHSTASPAPHH